MPEKKNDSKIMAMLERTGVIRKVGPEDGSLDTDSARSEPDIKPLFNTPDDTVKVTPAARQPIPGMPTPVFPSDKMPDNFTDLTQDEEAAESETVSADNSPAYEPEPYTEISAPQQPAAPAPPPPQPIAPPRPAPAFGGSDLYRSDDAPVAPPAPAEVYPQADRPPQPENYTDRFLNTDELYSALALRSKKTDSIYLIEEYLDTLPGSLPDAQRREIVNKLLAASGFDYDLLMGDGVLRVKMLKEYAERFARHTDDYIAARQAELEELDQQILRTRRLIENRRDLHKKQFFSIEAEAQRLKEILTFISG